METKSHTVDGLDQVTTVSVLGHRPQIAARDAPAWLKFAIRLYVCDN